MADQILFNKYLNTSRQLNYFKLSHFKPDIGDSHQKKTTFIKAKEIILKRTGSLIKQSPSNHSEMNHYPVRMPFADVRHLFARQKTFSPKAHTYSLQKLTVCQEGGAFRSGKVYFASPSLLFAIAGSGSPIFHTDSFRFFLILT